MPTPSTFQTILQLARNLDEENLSHLVRHGVAIGIKENSYTVIGTLAKENNTTAVNWLIQKYNGNIYWAAYGYGCGNHETSFDRLLKNTSNIEKKNSLKLWGIRGFAYAGNISKVNLLLAEKNSNNLSQLKLWAVRGYAAQDWLEAEKIINKCSSSDEKEKLQQQIIYCHVKNKNFSEIDAILSKATPKQLSDLKQLAINTYARSGHGKQVLKLLEQETDPEILNELLLWACEYAASELYIDDVAEYFKLAGNDEYQIQLLKRAAINAYAIEGAVEQVNTLLNDELDEFDLLALKLNAVEGYFTGEQNILGSQLIDKSNSLLYQEIKKTITAAFLKQASTIKIKYFLAHIKDVSIRNACLDAPTMSHYQKELPKIAKLHQTMQEQELDYAQAKAWLLPSLQAWLLQGIQLVQQEKLSFDVFIHVITFFEGSSYQGACRFYEKYQHYSQSRFFTQSNAQTETSLAIKKPQLSLRH